MNYSVVNYNRQGKHRRLWRLAVATQPSIADYYTSSAPCPEGTRIYQKPTASSEGAQLWDKQPSPSLGSAKRDRLSSSTSYRMCQSPFGELYLGGGVTRTHSCAASQLAVGFHYIGPAPRNPQLLLNLLAFMGCVATARRHSLLSLFLTWRTIPNS